MNLIENISVVKLNLHNLQCNNLQQNLQKNQADLEENAGRKKLPWGEKKAHWTRHADKKIGQLLLEM